MVHARRRASVDVFVPNRNYAHYLPACLDSVLAQQGVDVRVLVVDNASTDDSSAVAQAYADRDPRVTVLRHERDLGLVASLDEGLAWCEAEHCMNLSADDVLLPGALARATAVLQERPRTAFVYGPAVQWEGGPVRVRQVPLGGRTWDGQDWIARCARDGRNPLFSPEGVMRTELAQETHFRPELPRTPDLAMWLQLAARGDVAHLRGVRQALYRIHPTSMMQTQGHVGMFEARYDAFTVLVRRDGHLLRDAGRVADDAARAVALQALRLVELHGDWRRQDRIDVPALLDLAVRVWPRVEGSPAWASAHRACARSAASPARFAHMVGHKLHDVVDDRLRRELGR